MTKYLTNLLKKELYTLDSAKEMLQYSYEMCKNIGIKPHYSFDEMDRFEAFTSRFARLSKAAVINKGVK